MAGKTQNTYSLAPHRSECANCQFETRCNPVVPVLVRLQCSAVPSGHSQTPLRAVKPFHLVQPVSLPSVTSPSALAPYCTELAVSQAPSHLRASASSSFLGLESLSPPSWGESRKSSRAQLSHPLLLPESSFLSIPPKPCGSLSLGRRCRYSRVSLCTCFPSPAGCTRCLVPPDAFTASTLLVDARVGRNESQTLVWEQLLFQR